MAIAIPPPAFDIPPPPRQASGQQLITYISGAVRCGGQEVAPLWREPVVPNEGYAGYPNSPALQPRTIAFRVDATGRPLSIRQVGDADRMNPQVDVESALAAWRFASGAALADCTVTFTPQAYAPDQAPPLDAMRYAGLPNITGGGINVWRSFERAGSNCGRDRPDRRVIVFPRFDRIEQAPGRLSVSFYRYDVDANGKPRNVSAIGSGDNPALETAGAQALRQWRFVEGEPHQGCRTFFWRGGKPLLAAPEIPASLGPDGDKCPEQGKWDRLPDLAAYYPANFRRRGIEGWAVVRFDVAPWGQVGDIEVLASEPADAFGKSAANVVAQSRLPKSETSRIGCVERVRFALPSREKRMAGSAP